MKRITKVISIFTSLDEKFNRNPVPIAIRRGLTCVIPIVLLGSMALLIISFPVAAYQEYMLRIFGQSWKAVFTFMRDGTFNVLSLIMVLCISYHYALERRKPANPTEPVTVSIVALSSFIALLGITKEGFSISNYGVIGMFLAILVSISASVLFIKLRSIRFMQLRAYTDGAGTSFNSALSAIVPAAITITLFAAINQAMSIFLGITDIQLFISDSLVLMFSKIQSPFGGAVLFMLLVHIFWFFGMHGSNILEPVAQKVLVPALEVNQRSIASGLAPVEIVSKTFIDSFVLMGGCGAALCLVAAILIFGRHKNQLRLIKLSIAPVIFNINEIVVFGLPIVFNPVYLLPFIFVPLLLTLTSYFAVFSGLVPVSVNHVEWTTPIFLSGYIATGSIKGSFLQLFNLLLGTMCYFPFVKMAERLSDRHIKDKLKQINDSVIQLGEHRLQPMLLSRQDDIGNISRFLAADLKHDFQSGKIKLFFQPQVDFDGCIIGAEALLRWKHESYDYIFPPLIIALAEETGLINQLGYWIMEQACICLKEVERAGFNSFLMSINFSASQLENENLLQELSEIILQQGINPENLQIEITEQTAISGGQKTVKQISSIKKIGLKIAMDDFGKGYSSLMYLKEFDFDTIKLDGSLITEINTNLNCSNIVSSIVYLGRSSNYSVVAEYVETPEQRLKLHELGCDKYQGYLYSCALNANAFMDYLMRFDKKSLNLAMEEGDPAKI